MLADGLAQHVVGRCQLLYLAMIPDQKMAVAGSHIKPVDVILQLPAYCRKQLRRLPGADLVGAVVDDPALPVGIFFLRERYDISPQRNVCLLHLYADAEGLQGRTARVILPGIVPQHR